MDHDDPIAIDPVLRGVDMAIERLLLFDILTNEAFSCLNALRYELSGHFPPAGFGGDLRD